MHLRLRGRYERISFCSSEFQIATELRVRDIGGIIVVDFIDMEDASKSRPHHLLFAIAWKTSRAGLR
jgi:Ribonuclease G/E